MAVNIPHTRGQHATLKLFQDGKNVYLAIKNWTISENATEVNEGVNGEDRDRLDKVTNFYTISFDAYCTDFAAYKKYMEAQQKDDDASLPSKQTMSIQLKHRDGTRTAMILTEGKLGPIDVNAAGRADSVMFNCKARARYFKPVTSI